MIQFDEGLTLCGRVTWGFKAGYITSINSRTYRVRWLDDAETEQLRPDYDGGHDDLEFHQAAE